ncbi:MAG TPA: hypothetical protein VG937_37740 [Polyangiaceae bacterium]|nr:hypothetical protein [Polyangiaceae bacterium]
MTIVPSGVPADVRIDFTFSAGSGQIQAAVRSWAEKESVDVHSERVRWLEDFQARRRTIQPMPEADAQAFRQQIVEEIKKLVQARTAAVVIASEPADLPVVTTVPESTVAPLNRNRTVALLGCLRDGAELEGYVTWPDGRREQFKRQANQTPGRFVVGSPTASERPPLPESPSLPDAGDVETEPAIGPKEQPTSKSWYWWFGAPVMVIVAWAVRARMKKR